MKTVARDKIPSANGALFNQNTLNSEYVNRIAANLNYVSIFRSLDKLNISYIIQHINKSLNATDGITNLLFHQAACREQFAPQVAS